MGGGCGGGRVLTVLAGRLSGLFVGEECMYTFDCFRVCDGIVVLLAWSSSDGL